MSSNQRPETAATRSRPRRPVRPTAPRPEGIPPAVGLRPRVRRALAGVSLRARMVVVLIGMIALVCAGVGTFTAFAVHRLEIQQLDKRLRGAGDRFRHSTNGTNPSELPDPRDGSRPDPWDMFPRGQGPDTLQARVVNGKVMVAQYLDDTEQATPQVVPEAAWAALATLPTDQRPRTRDLGSLGDYRLIAVRTPNGDFVTGLPLRSVDALVRGVVLTEIGVGLLVMLFAGVGGAAIVRVTLRPLRRIAATAGRVAELPLHEGEVALSVRVPDADTDPRTEVGRVGSALNRMLGHVGSALAARQASEMRLRRFVADASHELRTPLAAIRGYTELTRRHRASTPPDVAHALDGVQTAAGRMTTLVEDLLLLARLDAGRPLEHEPVDLSLTAIEALGEAHAAGRDHVWQLDLPEEPVLVTGDAARLHQVLANLLANARVHTPAGTKVTVGVVPAGGDGPREVTLTVTDDGPGIPAELLPRIFERFTRGDVSRSRTAGSSGLGLSIVYAVVGAHGGRVDVASEPGRTVFTVCLPAA